MSCLQYFCWAFSYFCCVRFDGSPQRRSRCCRLLICDSFREEAFMPVATFVATICLSYPLYSRARGIGNDAFAVNFLDPATQFQISAAWRNCVNLDTFNSYLLIYCLLMVFTRRQSYTGCRCRPWPYLFLFVTDSPFVGPLPISQTLSSCLVDPYHGWCCKGTYAEICGL